MQTNLFGMDVSVITLGQAVEKAIASSRLDASLVVTPNLDHLQRFIEDPKFRELYSLSNLTLADGMPIVWFARIMNRITLERITGVDFFTACLGAAELNQVQVAIVGGSDEVLALAAAKIREMHPRLGPIFIASPSWEEIQNPHYIEILRANLSGPSPKIVALCFGSPKQELIFESVFKGSGIIGTFIGAGATVDFLAGTKKRSPKFIQRLGLEWFFRFSLEPKRLFRRYFGNLITFVKLFTKALAVRLNEKKVKL